MGQKFSYVTHDMAYPIFETRWVHDLLSEEPVMWTRPNSWDQDQNNKTKNKTKAYKTKTGLSYHGCSYNTRTAHHQNRFL